MAIPTKQEFEDFIQGLHAGIAWPGMYKRHLVLQDGEALCHQCSVQNKPDILNAIEEHDETGPQKSEGWLPVGININRDSKTLYCTQCSQRIPAEYE